MLGLLGCLDMQVQAARNGTVVSRAVVFKDSSTICLWQGRMSLRGEGSGV